MLQIHEHFPQAQFFVPLGNQKWFHSSGIKHGVHELDWWDEVDLTLNPSTAPSNQTPNVEKANPSPSTVSARISCLPNQHTAARGPFDRDHTLWSSWSISSSGSSIYFAGDTGYRAIPLTNALPANIPPFAPETSPEYNDWIPALSHLPVCPAFEQIGTLRGPFDLGLLPIGAYAPREFFSAMHCNPQDAVRIFRDTKCKRALAMHWGTWALTEEDAIEPKERLRAAVKEMGIGEEVEGEGCLFGVCAIGESREFESG